MTVFVTVVLGDGSAQMSPNHFFDEHDEVVDGAVEAEGRVVVVMLCVLEVGSLQPNQPGVLQVELEIVLVGGTVEVVVTVGTGAGDAV